MNPSSRRFFPLSPRAIRSILVALMLLAGLGIRLYDLADLPLDFHPTRQLFTAIVARSYYYQMLPADAPVSAWERQRAAQQLSAEETEPPSIDWLAALTYRLVGRVDLFFPRLYSVLFWLAGGLALFWIALDLTSLAGGLLALGFYLFAPYGIVASRSFQPDPLMTALTLFAWWCMLRWARAGARLAGWKWAVAAGLLSGAAMMVKALAVFTVLGGMAGAFFACASEKSFRQTIHNPQFWVMGLVAAAPVLAWTVSGFSAGGTLGSQFALRFFPALWFDPLFYLRWERMLEQVAGLLPITLALLGWFFFRGRSQRLFAAGLWGGYLLFGFVFAYYFTTHNYYHIALVPIAAISLAPLGQVFSEKLAELRPGTGVRLGLALVLLAGLGMTLWNVRADAHKTNYRGQDAYWANIGELIQHDGHTVALTQDYGYRLAYWGWTSPAYWPYTGDLALRQLAGYDLPGFQSRFDEIIRGNHYFLITDLREYDHQPQLRKTLEARYPVFAAGEGFIIYDLKGSK
jgi:hypothetical protein